MSEISRDCAISSRLDVTFTHFTAMLAGNMGLRKGVLDVIGLLWHNCVSSFQNLSARDTCVNASVIWYGFYKHTWFGSVGIANRYCSCSHVLANIVCIDQWLNECLALNHHFEAYRSISASVSYDMQGSFRSGKTGNVRENQKTFSSH